MYKQTNRRKKISIFLLQSDFHQPLKTPSSGTIFFEDLILKLWLKKNENFSIKPANLYLVEFSFRLLFAPETNIKIFLFRWKIA